MRKSRKKLVVILLILISFCLFIYLFVFNTTHFHFAEISPQKTIDNTVRNKQTLNDSITAVDDTIYFCVTNSSTKFGIYACSKHFTHRIYGGGFSLYPPIPAFGFSYNGMLLEDSMTKDDDGTAYIHSITESAPVVKIDKQYNAVVFFTFDNELFFWSEDMKVLYQYDTGNIHAVASEELCGKGYAVEQIYQHYLFYDYPDTGITPKNESFPQKLYQYNFITCKVERVIDFTGMSDVYEQMDGSICQYLICDNCVFLEFKRDSRNTYYMYNIDTHEVTKMMETTVATSFNAYGDTAYVVAYSYVNEFDEIGLYFLKENEKQAKKVCDGNFDEVCIADEGWIYLAGVDASYYRLSSDGEIIEKIF